MKKFPKILIITFFSIFILQMICLIILLAVPQESRAADASEIKFAPQVSIPGSNFTTDKAAAPSIAKYIKAVYNYAIGIVGILAAVVLMFGGVRWLLAGGSPDKISDAKAWIGASLTGLILALTSYMILNTINPDLVTFKDIAPKNISEYKNGACSNYTEEQRCLEAVGCKWEGNKCIENSQYSKCGLTKEEKTEVARCCQKGTEYKYALLSIGKYCLDVCGSGWILVDADKCKPSIGY